MSSPCSLIIPITSQNKPVDVMELTPLPPGLVLAQNPDTSEVLISGNVPNGGDYSFTLMATDSKGNKAQKSFTLTVLGLINNQPPSGTVGYPYSFSFGAAGGNPPYSFSATNLPPGLTLSTSGVLSGTPTGSDASYYIPIHIE